MTATDHPSYRELLEEAIDLLRGAAEYRKEFSAFLNRAREIDAEPINPPEAVQPVPTAEHWRVAYAMHAGQVSDQCWSLVSERAHEIARERSNG